MERVQSFRAEVCEATEAVSVECVELESQTQRSVCDD